MFKTRRRAVFLVSDFLLMALTVVLTAAIIPAVREDSPSSALFMWSVSMAVFIVLAMLFHINRTALIARLEHTALYTGETSVLTEFLEKLRYCYSLEEFYGHIASILEEQGDCSVLFVDRSKNYVLYNSPDRLTSDKSVMQTLELNFPAQWKDGFYYLSDRYGVVSTPKTARGFFLVHGGYHLYVFCRYTRLFDSSVYSSLFDEFARFQKRNTIITDLSEISSLTQEWQQLADTQRSFLPPRMPDIKKLQLAAYFRPLVNVSGDYYSVLPITENRTLLMLGDVSGKGLAAALVMGLVMNTIKIMENKDDLPGVIYAVDKAIKGMKLQDKYTVLFMGIVDTEAMTITYINASMSDPIIITRSPDGYRIKPLTSNCSLVGIIELDDVKVAQQRLFRGDVILMASDGVSEVMDEKGIELGTTTLYQDTIKAAAAKHPKEFVTDVVNLIMKYNGNKKLRDDVTMLVAKIGV